MKKSANVEEEKMIDNRYWRKNDNDYPVTSENEICNLLFIFKHKVQNKSQKTNPVCKGSKNLGQAP